MKSVLIFGREGYLASAFAGYLTSNHLVHRTRVDVTDAGAVAREVAAVKPAFAINAAGITHGRQHQNIDGCEESAMMKNLTRRTNVGGALIVADVCERAGVPLVHLGSGCVYDGYGAVPLQETTRPNPPSFYSETKAEGDAGVAAIPGTLVLKLRMPFGMQDHPRNLLSKLARYANVVDAPNSITFVPALLKTAVALVESGVTGTFHVVQPEAISPYRLMLALGYRVEPWTPDELNLHVLAKRSNCVLATDKLNALGVHLHPVSKILGLDRERIVWQGGSA